MRGLSGQEDSRSGPAPGTNQGRRIEEGGRGQLSDTDHCEEVQVEKLKMKAKVKEL